jgi:solute carrier family 13 (sodium-dependent dicarboxylate transporter), member 2/3/5
MLLLLPTPAGLRVEGQRALVMAALAVVLWGTEALPSGVTSIVVVLGLLVSGAVAHLRESLAGFADPATYFLMGVLTIGLAVSRSGLAERIAQYFLYRAHGCPRALYAQMLLSFPLLTLLLPSATTRTAILVHVYEHALDLAGVRRGAPLAKAVMLALNSVNRLASTLFLTGGITSVMAAGLLGGIAWGQWLVLMSVPYLVLLVIGAATIYIQYRQAFEKPLPSPKPRPHQPLSAIEWRTLIITLGASVLWLTDALHHWDAAVPALLAWACLLMPRFGVLSWTDFEQNIGWANFFVIGSSLSLGRALTGSGAGEWVAKLLVRSLPCLNQSPLLVIVLLLFASALVRLIIPNISGFLATTIPLALAIGKATGLNPLLCGLVATIAGDAVLYYPAQSASSLTVYERGHLSAGEIFRFGVVMTLVAAAVVLLVALPYWRVVGEPLVLRMGS